MGDRRRQTGGGRQETRDKRRETANSRQESEDMRGERPETEDGREEMKEGSMTYVVQCCGAVAWTFWSDLYPEPV